jgi:hypothetical protein
MSRNRGPRPPSQVELRREELRRAEARRQEVLEQLQAECAEIVVPYALKYFEDRCGAIQDDDDWWAAWWEMHIDSMVEPWTEKLGHDLLTLPLETDHYDLNANGGMSLVVGEPCQWWLNVVAAHTEMVDRFFPDMPQMPVVEFGRRMCIAFMGPYNEAVRHHNTVARSTPTNFHSFARQHIAMDPQQRQSNDDYRTYWDAQLNVSLKFLSAYARQYSPQSVPGDGLVGRVS